MKKQKIKQNHLVQVNYVTIEDSFFIWARRASGYLFLAGGTIYWIFLLYLYIILFLIVY
jgi:hypothetical protein